MELQYRDPDEIRRDRLEKFSDNPNSKQQKKMITEEILMRIKQTKRNIYYLGRVMYEAKPIVGHGKFKKYIEEEIGISYSLANNFINVYLCCLNNPKIVETIKPSILYQLSAPKCSKDFRKYLFDRGEYLKDVKSKDMKDVLEKYNSGEIGLDSDEVQKLIEYHEQEASQSEYVEALEASKASLKELSRYVIKQVSAFSWPTEPAEETISLTRREDREIKDTIQEMEAALQRLKPTARIVENHEASFSLASEDQE